MVITRGYACDRICPEIITQELPSPSYGDVLPNTRPRSKLYALKSALFRSRGGPCIWANAIKQDLRATYQWCEGSCQEGMAMAGLEDIVPFRLWISPQGC
jgi:hypothetical protein